MTEALGTSRLTRKRAAIVLASAGRPELLAAVMRNLQSQTERALDLVLSVPDEVSLPRDFDRDRWRVVMGARGLAAQRNAALETLPAMAPVFFFDDDAVVRDDFVANALAFFDDHPEVVGLTGRVLLDGASTEEVPAAVADRAIAASRSAPLTGSYRRSRELYGCNFAVRMAAAPDIRFDDRLPLYSWLEDHDLARRLMRIGELAKVDDCVIVHRGATSGGRQAHERLGYSQVMNPFYLWRKGSFPTWLMGYETGPRVAKNVVGSLLGEERTWRRRRLRGNVLALADLLRGRVTPERIVHL